MAKKTAKPTAKILIAHGVNLDLLGAREPDIYGSMTLKDINESIADFFTSMAPALGLDDIKLEFFQSNNEEAFLDKLSQPWLGVIMNPGAWTHTSLALADRLKALRLPFVEVHLSNLAQREEYRHHSYAAKHALGVVYGFGPDSYIAGLTGLMFKLVRDR